MTEIVSYEQRGAVALLRMDDGKANALSSAWVAAMGAALDRAERVAKAVVLLGRPGRFSAGFDLKVMMSSPDAARALVLEGGALMLRCLELRLPLVTAATGHAIAGGVLLLATGDVRLGAAGDFKLGLNEVANGMPVPIFAHELARMRLDPRALEESVLRARMYSPDEAARVGWLDRVVPADALESAALAEAEALAVLPQPAYGTSKRSVRAAMIAHVRDTMASNLESFRIGT